jgi:branched-chain amino acid transport system substrate-binding protein
VLKLIAAKPDAVLVAGVAADAALPHSQLVDAGYKGMIFQTHGAASPDFIKIGGKKVDGALVVGPLLLVPEQISDSVPTKKLALELDTSYERLYGVKPPIFAAGVYDAGLLLQHAIPEALKKGKPGTQEFRTALRDALEGTKGLPASQGVITMTPQDHSGFDDRGRVLLTIKDGKWLLVKD